MRSVTDIRGDFPIFSQHPELVYLDSAATSHKPESVIAGITNFYRSENSNIHRGIYDLAAQTSAKYEAVRQKVASLIGADSEKEIVYTSGTTDSINLVAHGFLAQRLNPGDEVLISAMEHHANLIPWQMVCKWRGAKLRIIPLNAKGEIDIKTFQGMLSDRVKMLAVVHISNSLGSINPVEEMISEAHKYDIPVLLDGAQSIAHVPVDVKALDCDFLAFSGHKMFGPTGIGVLYGKAAYLEEMQPVRFGGDMIRLVSYEDTTFAPAPQKFEAGTTNIAGVIGLGYAVDYLAAFDRGEIHKRMKELRAYALDKLREVPEIRIIGQSDHCSGIVSFMLGNVHPHDVATFLGAEQIAVRAGHHCTQPLMDLLEIPATTRASFSIYSQEEEIDRLAAELKNIHRFFS
ncbi:MAG: SufS family cysteine desulfurase [Bacteroidia bacterium]|nr:SufS family cysteine desulfurase [Bacteroidia bacterium]